MSEALMWCPYCGYEITRDSHFCKNCGKVVNDSTEEGEESLVTGSLQANVSNSNKEKDVGMIGAIALVISIVGFVLPIVKITLITEGYLSNSYKVLNLYLFSSKEILGSFGIWILFGIFLMLIAAILKNRGVLIFAGAVLLSFCLYALSISGIGTDPNGTIDYMMGFYLILISGLLALVKGIQSVIQNK